MWKIKSFEGGYFTAGDENEVTSWLNSLPKEVADTAKVSVHKHTFFVYYYEK